jgi:hypothetical protein
MATNSLQAHPLSEGARALPDPASFAVSRCAARLHQHFEINDTIAGPEEPLDRPPSAALRHSSDHGRVSLQDITHAHGCTHRDRAQVHDAW